MSLSLFFCLVKKKKSLYASLPFFPFFQVTMSQDRIVTCFHEYVMKKKKEVRSISTLYHSNSKSSSKV